MAADYSANNEVLLLRGSFSSKHKKYYYKESVSSINWTWTSICPGEIGDFISATRQEEAYERIPHNRDVFSESRLLTFPDGSTMELSGGSRAFYHTYYWGGTLDATASYAAGNFATGHDYHPACGYTPYQGYTYPLRYASIEADPVVTATDPSPTWEEYILISCDIAEDVYLFERRIHSLPYDWPQAVYPNLTIDDTRREFVLRDKGVLRVLGGVGETEDESANKTETNDRDHYFDFTASYNDEVTQVGDYTRTGIHDEFYEYQADQMMSLVAGNPSAGMYFSFYVGRDRDHQRLLNVGGYMKNVEYGTFGVCCLCEIDNYDVASAYGAPAGQIYLVRASRV
jgi:hypothetical protein